MSTSGSFMWMAWQVGRPQKHTVRLNFYAAICCCEVTKFCISLVKFVTTNMVTNLIPVQHLMNLKYITSYLCVAFSWRVDGAQLYPGTGTHNGSLPLTNTHIYSNLVDSLWALLLFVTSHSVWWYWLLHTSISILFTPASCIMNGVSAPLTLYFKFTFSNA